MSYELLRGVSCFIFFFQAEDGIRDLTVTGVQTCALPISALEGLYLWSMSNSPRFQRMVRSRRGPERERGGWGKSVDLGGGRIIKKKNKNAALLSVVLMIYCILGWDNQRVHRLSRYGYQSW